MRGVACNRLAQVAGLLAVAAFAVTVAGCRVQGTRGANGEEKEVQVDTPFGGIHMNTNQTTATDLGLPVYPGAQIARDKENDKSADIHMGFGQWDLRVKVVNYSTPDSRDKVADFYKKALGRYGVVIACQHDAPVGSPTATSEGLTCASDSGHANVNDHGVIYGYHKNDNGLELKAGSKRHQHIVGFESSASGETRFALVEVDLPAGIGGYSEKSD